MKRTLLLAVVCLATLTGCGGKTNSVSGKVTHNGQPVTGGSITFLPQGEGKPAAANVDASGNYKMTPSGDTGGAVVGKHRVTYSAPVAELPAGTELKPGESPPKSPFDGLKPKEEVIDVTAGSNTIDIELVK
jgi:hypothetical protein